MLELAMSLTTPFATYWLCESLLVSGVLGVVAVGLYRSRWAHLRSVGTCASHHSHVLARSRVCGQLPGVRVDRHPVAGNRRVAPWVIRRSRGRVSWGLIAVLSFVAIGVRFLWIFTATYGVRLLVPSLQRSVIPRRPGFRPSSAGAA